VYNLMSAAAAAGVNRSTVLRAIKAGRISAQRDSNNNWEIDPAEFHRVFPPLPSIAAASPQHDQQQIDGQVALLRNFVEQLRNDLVAREEDHKQARGRLAAGT
jgi:predicted site-specific integrase-resolvase